MLTLEQIDSAIAELEAGQDPFETGEFDAFSICQLARERLTAGTFQQGIEAVIAEAGNHIQTHNEAGLCFQEDSVNRDRCFARARAVMEFREAIRNLKQEQTLTSSRLFKEGDLVTKTRGSCWTGKVVGFYSTDLTPIGYAVESATERGSVQIYPETALKRVKTKPESAP